MENDKGKLKEYIRRKVEKQISFNELLENYNLPYITCIVDEICQIPMFQRLQDISYFGSGEYYYSPPYRYTRYQHCINTAYYIAVCLLSHRCVESDVVLGIIWGLTHDLGHIIFSHTGEEAAQQVQPFHHETYTEELLQDTAFHDIFTRHGISYEEICIFRQRYWFMCESHFDIDTLCGITDFAQIFQMTDFSLSHLLSEGLQKPEEEWIWTNQVRPLIKAFWNLKSKVYHDYVYVLENEACDLMIQQIIQLCRFPYRTIGEHEFLKNLQNQPYSDAAKLWEKIEARQFWQFVSSESMKQVQGILELPYHEVEVLEKLFHSFNESDLPNSLSWSDLHAFLNKRYQKQRIKKYFIEK